MSRPGTLPRRLLLAAALIAAPRTLVAAPLPPPVTAVEGVRDTLHGVVVEDPFRWLEDQESPRTRQWIDAQNVYTEAVLGPVEPSRESLRRQLAQLLEVESVSVPFERGGRYFYSRRRADQDLPVLCMRQGLEGKEEVLVDPHALSPDHTISVNFLDVSDDGRLLAYGTRSGGEDEVTVTFLDLETREVADRMPRARYSGISITPDRTRCYSARRDRRGSRVYSHRLGSDPAGDLELFGDRSTPEENVGSDLSSDGRWLVLTVSHGSASNFTEIYVKEVARDGPIVPIVNDVRADFRPIVAGDRMFLETDWEAPNRRILEVDLRRPARANWREVVPEAEVAIQGTSAVDGRLCVRYLEDAISRVRVFEFDGRRVGSMRFPTLGALSAISGRWDRPGAFFTFQSFHLPATIYRYDVRRGRRSVWWQPQVPFRSDRFEVRQEWVTSKDGTRLPMFVAHRKGLRLDGRNPALLTGYGGFKLSQTPAFSARAVVWMERGGVYALANLRGGGEYGEAWHQAGMLERKQNVFDDFVAAAQHLVDRGYTRPERLAISGTSNGGLLVGAALTQRPDLFRAVVCGFPLLDMLRYHRFLVAPLWVPEYGSAEDATQFLTLRAYSPYQHVQANGKYPAVLLISGDSDTRVAPLHARKMTAMLQSRSASGRPVLLSYDTRAGHSRANKPIGRQIDDTALELQFLLWQVRGGSSDHGRVAGP